LLQKRSVNNDFRDSNHAHEDTPTVEAGVLPTAKYTPKAVQTAGGGRSMPKARVLL
jgi:hypothetical protein